MTTDLELGFLLFEDYNHRYRRPVTVSLSSHGRILTIRHTKAVDTKQMFPLSSSYDATYFMPDELVQAACILSVPVLAMGCLALVNHTRFSLHSLKLD